MPAKHARARIAENRITFDGLISDATRAIDASRFRSAAVTLQSAARFAWYNHPGLFRSLKLEELAAQIGEQLPINKSADRGLTGHVVHVLSQAYSAGGHTRLVWRWIENDDKHVNSVVITGQQGVPIPHQLVDAVMASGGQVITLGEGSSNLLVRAAELRGIAESGADTMVLHVHPYDIVPSIGLTDVAAKVVFLNHADHVFWIGGSVADVVADIRPAGQQLSLARRNVAEADSAILPIPLGAPSRIDKQRARAQLGMAPDALVIISIASGYKYGASAGNHFIDIHRDFVLAHPEVTLLVIGPEPTARWLDVSEETGGRFRAVGMVRGINNYYDAADVYVDSIPFASLTSLLDAALRGVPVLALNEAVADSVLTSNDLSLTNKSVHFSDRQEYIEALENLVDQPDDRRLIAEGIRDAVANDHLPPGWNRQLNQVFDSLERGSARHASRVTPSEMETHSHNELEYALVEFQDASGLSAPLWTCQLRDAPYRSALERAQLLMTVPAGHRIKSLKFMVPDVVRSKLKVQHMRFVQNSKHQ